MLVKVNIPKGIDEELSKHGSLCGEDFLKILSGKKMHISQEEYDRQVKELKDEHPYANIKISGYSVTISIKDNMCWKCGKQLRDMSQFKYVRNKWVLRKTKGNLANFRCFNCDKDYGLYHCLMKMMSLQGTWD